MEVSYNFKELRYNLLDYCAKMKQYKPKSTLELLPDWYSFL